MATNLTMIEKLISETKQAHQTQSDILNNLSKGNVNEAVSKCYKASTVNDLLHSLSSKVALNAPVLKEFFMKLSSSSFTKTFADDVGNMTIEPNKQLNKALSEYFEVPSQYKNGTVITENNVSKEKLDAVSKLLYNDPFKDLKDKDVSKVLSKDTLNYLKDSFKPVNSIVNTLNDQVIADKTSEEIQGKYSSNIKSWYEGTLMSMNGDDVLVQHSVLDSNN